MPSTDLVNLKKEKVGSVDLDEGLFASKVNRPLIHEAVVMQQASMRQGTAATKTRGQVRGGGKKPWRQKGTSNSTKSNNSLSSTMSALFKNTTMYGTPT